MKVCALFVALLALEIDARDVLFSPMQLDRIWRQYKKNHNKSYSPAEELKRRQAFMDNMRTVVAHNLEYDLGLKSFKLGLTGHADLVCNYAIEKCNSSLIHIPRPTTSIERSCRNVSCPRQEVLAPNLCADISDRLIRCPHRLTGAVHHHPC